MRRGAICAAARTTSGASPFRGGSTQITSGRSPLAAKSAATADASPQKNSTFSTLLRFALAFASSMASGTISAPMTRPACRAITCVMVPAPQYRSSTVSVPVSPANSTALAYSLSAISRFT